MAKTAPTLEEQADQAATAGDPAAAVRLLERAAAEDGESPALWAKLSAMRRAIGDTPGALEAVDRTLALSPLDFSALLARALLLDRAGDPRAGEAFSRAVAQAPADDAIPGAMAAALDQARRKSEEHKLRTEERLLAAVPRDLGPVERRRIERFVSNSARRTRHFHQDPTDFHYPGLPELEFHDVECFPALARLEASAGVIRSEFDALIAAEAAEMVPYVQYSDQVPLRQWKELNFSRDWTAIHLLQNGRRIDANARHCPRTLEAISALPQPHVPGACPNAMFSLLAPHTRIPPHTGVANTRLVCHLALIVPPGCGFRVGETIVQWVEGKAFVFDDTVEHEAWNDSDQLRVVLILDLWPPALTEAERQAVAAIIPAAGVSFGGGM